MNSIAYVGTHDNEPVNGWMATAAPEDVARAVRYLNLTKQEGYHWGMMRGIWGQRCRAEHRAGAGPSRSGP